MWGKKKPKTAAPPRQKCPVCRYPVLVTPDGRIHQHGIEWGVRYVCPGAGMMATKIEGAK